MRRIAAGSSGAAEAAALHNYIFGYDHSTTNHPATRMPSTTTHHEITDSSTTAPHITHVRLRIITANDVPAAYFNPVAQGAVVTLNNASIGGGTYNWSFGDGNGSTLSNPVYTYSAEGTYTITGWITFHSSSLISSRFAMFQKG